MRWVPRNSIAEKLTWMNMLVSGSALLLACGAFMLAETVLFRHGMVGGLSSQAQIIGGNSVSALLFDDQQSAENTLAALHAAPHVKFAWIYTSQGQPFAGYSREGKTPPPPLPRIAASQSEDYWFREGHLELVRTVMFHGQLTAYVYIESDLAGLYDRLGTYAVITMGVLLASLLAAFLLSRISQRVVAQPIVDLSEVAQAVSRDENYAVRAIPTGAGDEISVLIDTFNNMLAQIQEREAERERLLDSERSARTEAERASLLKDEFLATLSHELRTPLNAILGWSHILRSRAFNDKELTHGLVVIDRNTRAQAQLVEDMLDMSRILSGKTRLDIQPVDLRDVVKAAVGSVQHAADAKGVRLDLPLNGSAGIVQGDPERLQQCLWNLLSNAIKFTPKDGRVRVALESAEGGIRISVVDTGEGIAPEFLPHVFERFRQADASTTRRHGGLGLGLSIVKHLVELHGGKIRAESAGLGRGASFVIELPALRAAPAAAPSALDRPEGSRPRDVGGDRPCLEGIAVLVVDDDGDARDLVKHILEFSGARVFLAASSEEALTLLSREHPDVILSDIGMPGEDGYQFIRKVRALPPSEGGSTPAAALTAFARAEERTRALRAGYQSHAAKPVKPAELTAVVSALAGQFRRGSHHNS